MNIILNWEWAAIVMSRMTVAKRIWTDHFANTIKMGSNALILDRHLSAKKRKP